MRKCALEDSLEENSLNAYIFLHFSLLYIYNNLTISKLLRTIFYHAKRQD